MAERRLGDVALLLCLCVCLMAGHARAASTEDAVEPIRTGRDCSLSIVYRWDEIAFSDLSVALYRVADVSADYQYTLTSPFRGTRLVLNGVESADEWSTIRSTLEAHILSNGVLPEGIAVTDETGQADFTGLKPGLYLATVGTTTKDGAVYDFASALVALPGLKENGRWQYQVAVAAKGQQLLPPPPDETVELSVLKLWKGDEGQSSRPNSIEVEIFRDGVSYQTVVLSEENHWSYSWTVKQYGADWMVVERNIPAEYSVSVEEWGTAFILTNTLLPGEEPPPQEAPKTGDTPHILLYTVLMYVSGAVLILLGLTGKRKDV